MKNNWRSVYRMIRCGIYSSMDISDTLGLGHVQSVELLYKAQRSRADFARRVEYTKPSKLMLMDKPYRALKERTVTVAKPFYYEAESQQVR